MKKKTIKILEPDLKIKIRVQEQQVELCEIPRIGGVER